MSSSAPDGSGPPDGRRRSMTRYINKVKTVLKPKSKRQSISGPSALAGATSEAPVEASSDLSSNVTDLTPAPAAIAATPEPLRETAPIPPPSLTPKSTPETTSIPKTEATSVAASRLPEDRPAKTASENVQAAQQNIYMTPPARSLVQQEKARALFAKYGLTLEPHEWTFPTQTPVARVEKPIRFRVRRICHLCSTTFGSTRICTNPECGHTRCQRCPRSPPKKARRPPPTDKTALMAGVTETSLANRGPIPGSTIEGRRLALARNRMKMPSRTGGQDLVHKPIRQRIHRTCDRCQAEFNRECQTCATCGHQMCVACPRSPAKLKKFPDGYPGDAPFEPEPSPVKQVERVVKKPVRQVRWTCHICDILFVEGAKICNVCQHERCSQCTRRLPKKIKPPPDPEVVKSLAEKLARLDVKEEPPVPVPEAAAEAGPATTTAPS